MHLSHKIEETRADRGTRADDATAQRQKTVNRRSRRPRCMGYSLLQEINNDPVDPLPLRRSIEDSEPGLSDEMPKPVRQIKTRTFHLENQNCESKACVMQISRISSFQRQTHQGQSRVRTSDDVSAKVNNLWTSSHLIGTSCWPSDAGSSCWARGFSRCRSKPMIH